jgi:hypothetical protein
MSRAYRIKVAESVKRVVRAHDHVKTQLELLEVLPAEQMAQLLEQELAGRGFERKGEVLVRTRDGVTVTVEPKTGTVTVQAQGEQAVEVAGEKVGRAFDDAGQSARAVEKSLRQELKKELEQKADQETEKLQKEVTDRLERALGELRPELNQAVNRVTAEALKAKARQLGEIKQMTEDPQSGSLTIVVEV